MNIMGMKTSKRVHNNNNEQKGNREDCREEIQEVRHTQKGKKHMRQRQHTHTHSPNYNNNHNNMKAMFIVENESK